MSYTSFSLPPAPRTVSPHPGRFPSPSITAAPIVLRRPTISPSRSSSSPPMTSSTTESPIVAPSSSSPQGSPTTTTTTNIPTTRTPTLSEHPTTTPTVTATRTRIPSTNPTTTSHPPTQTLRPVTPRPSVAPSESFQPSFTQFPSHEPSSSARPSVVVTSSSPTAPTTLAANDVVPSSSSDRPTTTATATVTPTRTRIPSTNPTTTSHQPTKSFRPSVTPRPSVAPSQSFQPSFTQFPSHEPSSSALPTVVATTSSPTAPTPTTTTPTPAISDPPNAEITTSPAQVPMPFTPTPVGSSPSPTIDPSSVVPSSMLVFTCTEFGVELAMPPFNKSPIIIPINVGYLVESLFFVSDFLDELHGKILQASIVSALQCNDGGNLFGPNGTTNSTTPVLVPVVSAFTGDECTSEISICTTLETQFEFAALMGERDLNPAAASLLSYVTLQENMDGGIFASQITELDRMEYLSPIPSLPVLDDLDPVAVNSNELSVSPYTMGAVVGMSTSNRIMFNTFIQENCVFLQFRLFSSNLSVVDVSLTLLH